MGSRTLKQFSLCLVPCFASSEQEATVTQHRPQLQNICQKVSAFCHTTHSVAPCTTHNSTSSRCTPQIQDATAGPTALPNKLSKSLIIKAVANVAECQLRCCLPHHSLAELILAHAYPQGQLATPEHNHTRWARYTNSCRVAPCCCYLAQVAVPVARRNSSGSQQQQQQDNNLVLAESQG